MYDLPNSSINSTMAMMNYVNNVSEGWLGPLMLVALFFVTFISLKNYPMDRAFGVSSFVCLLASAFLSVLELLNPKFLLLFVILTAFSVIYLYINNQEMVG